MIKGAAKHRHEDVDVADLKMLKRNSDFMALWIYAFLFFGMLAFALVFKLTNENSIVDPECHERLLDDAPLA
jgi:hypothetical protein